MSESGFLFLNYTSVDEKSVQAVRAFTHDLITKTMAKYNVSYEVAFLLLDHVHWNEDALDEKWAASQKDLLNEVHINFESSAAPNLESHLSAVESDIDICPICQRQRRLLQMYCGHKICTDCFTEEIKNSLSNNKKPACHQENCEAEFLSPDVEKMFPSNKSKVYKFWRLNLSYENSKFRVAICPNPLCKNVIVREKGQPCHSVKCEKCDFVLCMKCQNDAHDPVKCCKRVSQFTEQIPKEMNQLEQEEQKWYLRESKCKEYRFQKQGEVEHVFNTNLIILNRQHESEQKEVDQQIKNTDLFVQDLLSKIAQVEEKINQYKQKKRSPERIEALEKKIDGFREDIQHYKEFKEELLKENEQRKHMRKKELDFAKEQKKLFLKAIKNRENSEQLLQKYKDKVDKYAEEKAVEIVNEEDYIRKNTVICPSCGFRFYKESGCCEVRCPCGYDFCTVCNEPWITHKQGFYKCQNEIETKKIDYNDQNDSQFYPPPIDLEKKIYFAKWKHFHDVFAKKKAKYDELYQKYLLTDDKVPQKGKSLSVDDLSPFSKLVTLFESDGDVDARINALKLVSNLLYAQSVVAWGYVALSYLNITEFTQEYTNKLLKLESKVDQFIELLNDPQNHPAQDLKDHLLELNEETEFVLKDKL